MSAISKTQSGSSLSVRSLSDQFSTFGGCIPSCGSFGQKKFAVTDVANEKRKTRQCLNLSHQLSLKTYTKVILLILMTMKAQKERITGNLTTQAKYKKSKLCS